MSSSREPAPGTAQSVPTASPTSGGAPAGSAHAAKLRGPSPNPLAQTSSAPSADALASAANLLRKGGWTPGAGWAREVLVPPGFDYSLTEGPQDSPDWWAQAGVRPADGLPWSGADRASKAMLIAPAGAAGPLFLVLPNHFAIRTYNNSTAYALSVGLLADRFAGRNGPVTPWPAETPLSLADRMAAQTALARLGFDPGAPDGVIGSGTRTALRGWQKARGLPADGYLSIDLVRKLRDEAALPQ